MACGGARNAVVEDGGDVVGVFEASRGYQAREHGVEVVVVGLSAAQLGGERTERLGLDHGVDLVLDAENVSPAGRGGEVKVEGVEGMPAIMEQIHMRWQADDVIEYMNQLLRDNRGGTRIGFPLSVVSDILFLIDLKEIARTSEDEPAA